MLLALLDLKAEMAKYPQSPGQKTSRRVTSGGQNIHNLTSQRGSGWERLGCSSEKHVSSSSSVLLLAERVLQVLINNLVCKVVDLATSLAELAPSDELIKIEQPEPLDDIALSKIECRGKSLLWRAWRRFEAADRLPEEKSCCDVQGKPEEQGLQVDHTASLREAVEKIVYGAVEKLQVFILPMSELRPQHKPRMLPGFAFLCEDAVTKHRKSDIASRTKTPICTQKSVLVLSLKRRIASSPSNLLDRMASMLAGSSVP
jgi:hypothetical protein